jgi:peptidoglycan/xylan/chitin deacetylase (PgdA/CDA1 family)
MRAMSNSPERVRRAFGFAQWFRSHLSPSARRKVRALTDPLAGPLGSIRGVRTQARVVGLSFDDGPDPAYTSGILDVLSAHNATATWFVLVDRAEAHPELIARMLSEGHDVGLHGVDHSRLTRLSRQGLIRHIHEGVTRLSALTGQPVRFFRPPFGAQSLSSFWVVRREGMESVVWSADCDDWSQHPEGVIAERAISAASPGAVLLLHDVLAESPFDPAHPPTLDRRRVVELVVDGLASQGFRSVSLANLLRLGDVHRTLWFRP